MDKVKLNIIEPKLKKIEYNDQEIKVKPYMTIAEQVLLIHHYVKDYFLPDPELIVIQETSRNPVWAEIKMRLEVIKRFTDIDTAELDIDNFFASGLWEKITEDIKNYSEFYTRLNAYVSDIEKEMLYKKSLGVVIDDLAERLEGIINRLANITPEQLDKIKGVGEELLKEIESSPVSGVFRESAVQEKPVQKRRGRPKKE